MLCLMQVTCARGKLCSSRICALITALGPPRHMSGLQKLAAVLLGPSRLKPANLCHVGLQVVMLTWAYFAALLTDPGEVPAGWHPFPDDAVCRQAGSPPLPQQCPVTQGLSQDIPPETDMSTWIAAYAARAPLLLVFFCSVLIDAVAVAAIIAMHGDCRRQPGSLT